MGSVSPRFDRLHKYMVIVLTLHHTFTSFVGIPYKACPNTLFGTVAVTPSTAPSNEVTFLWSYPSM